MKIVGHHVREGFDSLFLAKHLHHEHRLGQTFHHYFVEQQMSHLYVSEKVSAL